MRTTRTMTISTSKPHDAEPVRLASALLIAKPDLITRENSTLDAEGSDNSSANFQRIIGMAS